MNPDDPKPETQPAGDRSPPRPPRPPTVGLSSAADDDADKSRGKGPVTIHLPTLPVGAPVATLAAAPATIITMKPRHEASPATPKVPATLQLRSVFFAFLLPGTVTLVVPYFVVAGKTGGQADPWRCLGLLPIGIGAAILIWCIRDFATVGRGTLAPIDPPRHLVVRGLYRHVRNPMYLGVAAILLGEFLFFWSLWLLGYAIVVLTAVHLFVVFYEEPALRQQFGASYDVYRQRVGRWLPGIYLEKS
jgi:protein-S-isoprenylcysteine O-methyltransferase Ste14